MSSNLKGTHVAIDIPATVSIANFFRKIHPEVLVAKLSDPVGLTVLSMLIYRNKWQALKLDESKYKDKITLYIPIDEVARRGCKVVRRMAVIAVQEYLTKLLYKELEMQISIRTFRVMGIKNITIVDVIEWFQVEYGLCDVEFSFLRLQQHLVRKKRKAKRSGKSVRTVL